MKPFKIQYINDIKCVVFEDGTKKIVYCDELYGDYILVDNELNNKDTLLSTTFQGRIKDAVDTIRNGNGDAFRVDANVYAFDIMYFLDRNIGEFLRAKALKGWSKSDFCWNIRFDEAGSGFRLSFLGKNNEGFDSFKNAKEFDTEQEAEEYFKGIIDRGYYYAKRCLDDVKVLDPREIVPYLSDWMDEIIAREGEWSAVTYIAMDIVKNRHINNGQKVLTELEYEVVQGTRRK